MKKLKKNKKKNKKKLKKQMFFHKTENFALFSNATLFPVSKLKFAETKK